MHELSCIELLEYYEAFGSDIFAVPCGLLQLNEVEGF